jgi:hypothetical protein
MRNLILHAFLLSGTMLSAGLHAGATQAHELWIEPNDFQPSLQAKVEARLVNGVEFGGIELAYLPNDFTRLSLILDDTETPVVGRIGDRPAINMPALGDGLHIAVYQSAGDVVTYAALEKFLSFATHKDFTSAAADHAARGLPEADFREYYTRFSKSLIGVAGAVGQDRPVGLQTEIVALANPYTDDLAAGMPVQVFYQGTPRADTQVELFARAPDGTVAITRHRTDATGIALLPVLPGHVYMADAVVLRVPGPALAGENVVWETLWANLTFAVPR